MYNERQFIHSRHVTRCLIVPWNKGYFPVICYSCNLFVSIIMHVLSWLRSWCNDWVTNCCATSCGFVSQTKQFNYFESMSDWCFYKVFENAPTTQEKILYRRCLNKQRRYKINVSFIEKKRTMIRQCNPFFKPINR